MADSTPTPFHERDGITVHHGDCVEVLRRLPDNSVDAVVTDPPYGLEFMGKEWDSFKPAAAGFRKPTSADENSSYRASQVRGTYPEAYRAGRPFQGWAEAWATECLRVLRPGGHMLAFGGTRTFHRLGCAVEDAGFEIRDSIAWMYGSGFPKSHNLDGDWQGWGTALKPAFEPVVVARKPLVGTVAANVLAHGTGALNVDGCRIEGEFKSGWSASGSKASVNESMSGDNYAREPKPDNPAGRWPANVILDESQADELDQQSGILSSGIARKGERAQSRGGEIYGKDAGYMRSGDTYGDSGGASRFFYVAKADATERPRVDGIAHPTVKPIALMRWLVRLATPPGGTVLEPFAGSGTTVEACLLEGFNCIAIEREADYLPLIMQRLNRRRDPVAAVKATGDDGGLFDLLDGGAA